MAKFYVASSWRNDFQQAVVAMLRGQGLEVYDFKHPAEADNGFHWAEIDGGWQSWDADRYRKALAHPVAERGFNSDFDAMKWADACVLVLPCGRSAHLEAGWFTGQGKPVCIYLNGAIEPELMYKQIEPTGAIVATPDELFDWVEKVDADTQPFPATAEDFVRWVADNATAEDPVWVARAIVGDYTFADSDAAPDWFKRRATFALLGMRGH